MKNISRTKQRSRQPKINIMKFIRFANVDFLDELVTFEEAKRYDVNLIEKDFYKRIGKEMPKKEVKKDSKKFNKYD